MKSTICHKLILVIIACLQTQLSYSTSFMFGPDKPVIDGRSNAKDVKPGDTIFLTASSRQFVLFRNLHGTAAKPVFVQNFGGVVTFSNTNVAIKFDTCSYVSFTGLMQGASYGFIASTVNCGIAIQGLSTCIEVAGVEISGATWTGVVAKTDPDCKFRSTRDKYTMRNISIHDNYLHEIANEGMYIGHSYYGGYTLHCNGKDTVVYPHLIRGLKVYNNRVENTGWDGIQVSSSDSACFVNNNYILNDSQAEMSGQMSGFLLGGGSSCNCFSNTVKDGKGDGIDELGLGGNYIYNNLIINPGKTYSGSGMKHGVYIGTQSPLAGRGYHIVFNTIISPKTNGIDFRSTAATGSEASDNIITNVGSSYIKVSSGATLGQENNLELISAGEVKFVNPAAGNYDLQPSSPAVNKGGVLSGFTPSADILGRTRPWPVKYDIGAYECHDSSLLSVNQETGTHGIELVRCSYVSGYIQISMIVDRKESLFMDLYSIDGRHLSSLCSPSRGPGLVEIEKYVGKLEEACYVCCLRFAGNTLSRKIITSSVNQ